jgi:drug/metabolite transporter (DMT)-like permease
MQFTASSNRPFIAFALAITWIVWGSTFFAIHVATETIPPFLLMGTRFVVAGSIAFAIALLRTPRSDWPAPRQWRDASYVGAGLITISMGATGWAATRLDTGIEALLTASGPLFIALLAMAGGVRPTRAAVLGLAIGLVGVGLLVVPGGGSAAVDPLGAILLVLSNVGWAAASLYGARTTSPGILFASGMQMIVGGALLLVASVAVGELRSFDIGAVDRGAVAGWLYLVGLGSLGGFLAYAWLLEHVSTTIASTHAFVNPLVAVGLGTLLLSEPMNGRTALAGAAVVVAVVLLMVGARSAEEVIDIEAAALEPQPARGRAARRPVSLAPGRAVGRSGGWSPAPTPAFARRTARPWQATDGMDALEIDDAFDQLL